MLVSGIFKQIKTFVDIPDALNRFSKMGKFSSSDVVYDVSIS